MGSNVQCAIEAYTKSNGTEITTLENGGILPFSVPENMEMILFLGFLSSGTEGRGFKLWFADNWSFPPELKIVLLIRTGGAGGLSSSSPLSDMVLNS